MFFFFVRKIYINNAGPGALENLPPPPPETQGERLDVDLWMGPTPCMSAEASLWIDSLAPASAHE